MESQERGKNEWRLEAKDQELLLLHQTELNPEILEFDKRKIITEGLNKCRENGAIFPASLEEWILFFEAAFLSKKRESYCLVTSIGLARPQERLGFRVGGCNIVIEGKIGLRFRRERTRLVREARDFYEKQIPSNYSSVKILTKGRSVYEAGNKAIDSINLLRAYWCLAINHKIPSQETWGKRRPVNQISLGPIHTLHHPNG